VASPQPHALATKERILQAAERLFRARGLSGTSLRSITTEAGVNVAALHYHFGGRDRLARAVFMRRVAPVNEERLRRLSALEAARTPVDLEALIRALVEPVFSAAQGDAGLSELGAILFAERGGDHAALAEEVFGEVLRRFRAAFASALPALPPREVYDRLDFFRVLSGQAPQRADGSRLSADRATQERLIRFLAAGFAAPAAPTEAS
jgi:AcrR family transcriptional regulator